MTFFWITLVISQSNKSMTSAGRAPPHALWRGNVHLSSMAILRPVRASRQAAIPPAGPAPMMATSTFMQVPLFPSVAKSGQCVSDWRRKISPKITPGSLISAFQSLWLSGLILCGFFLKKTVIGFALRLQPLICKSKVSLCLRRMCGRADNFNMAQLPADSDEPVRLA